MAIYSAATLLVVLARDADPKDEPEARNLSQIIATLIGDWPRQWEREKSQHHLEAEPIWKIRPESLKRIEELSKAGSDPFGLSRFDSRIVVCELLNSFPSRVFPNPVEMHASINFGIRPLLYAILRQQFMALRDIARCANTQCRDFFNLERTGQEFCSLTCSRQQRQRIYWKERGKRLRKKRTSKKRKE